VLDPHQMTLAKAGKLSFGSIKYRLWPRNIPYDYEDSIARSAKAVSAIQAAIHDYEKYTCLRFHRRKKERSYMLFFEGQGCSSLVGIHHGPNKISLSSGCWNKGTAIHEMGHALGFHHEQSRPDRDDYLIIHKENIPKDLLNNFDIEKDIDSRGTPYDYRSVMHYDKTAFGRGRITMETTDKYYTDLIGTGNGFSAMDIKQFNIVYKCPAYRGPLPMEPTPECHDYSSYCEMWYYEGHCKSDWGRKKCPLTCQQCKVGPRVETFPTRPGVTTKAPLPTTPPAPTVFVCRDKATFCEKYASKCTAGGSWKETMKKNCMKTCGYCK